MNKKTLMPVILSIVFSLGHFGCGKKSESQAFEKAFETNQTGEAKTTEVKTEITQTQPGPEAFAEPQVIFNDAADAMKKNDLPRASEALMVLRTHPNLTPAQWTAANDMMGKVQTDLAARAERGDKAAQQALENYRKNKRR